MKTYLCPLTKSTTMRNYNWDLIPAGRLGAPAIDDNRGLIQVYIDDGQISSLFALV